MDILNDGHDRVGSIKHWDLCKQHRFDCKWTVINNNINKCC